MSVYQDPSSPQPAACVIVVRDSTGHPEVLLLHRQPHLRSFGGFWVFPGGTVDATDAARPAVGLPATGDSLLAAAEAAGRRELKEEAGLVIDGGLTYFARWITPSEARRRFDTRFFVAAAPAMSELQLSQAESSEARWMALDEWAGATDSHELTMAPPTWLALRELAERARVAPRSHAGVAGLLPQEVTPVLPKIVGSGADACIVFPWDEDYASFAGEGIEWAPHLKRARAGWPSRLPLVAGLVRAP